MRTSSAKAKGRRCAKEMKEMMLKWCKELEPDDIVVTSSGDTGADLKLSPKAQFYYPFIIECKNQEKLNIWSAIKQCEGHKGVGIPIVYFKRNNTKAQILMDAEEFFDMLNALREDKK